MVAQRVHRSKQDVDRVGYNRQSTPYKQFALNGALGHLLGSSVSVAEKWRVPCYVCDMTAGPGYDPTGNEGSPLIIAKHIMAQVARGKRITLICVDRNEQALETLRATMTNVYPALTIEYYADQRAAIERIPLRALGFSYWDTTRYNDLDADLLKQFGRTHRNMGILITRECLAGYRMQRAAHCPGTLAIQDYLALTGKKRNYIMQYAKHGWWSLGFADNWEQRPVKKMGLIDVNSPDGREQWRKWTVGAPAEDEPLAEQDAAQATATTVREVSLWG